MTFWNTYLLVVAGILISVIYPILRRALPKAKGGPAGPAAFLPRAFKAAKPYIVTLLFALVTAFLILAFLDVTLGSWKAALLAGFAWEATIEKVKNG